VEALVAAGERHARDLAILARAAPDGCRCIFAVQAFAPVAAHVPSPEEERLFGLTEALAGPSSTRVHGFAAEHWGSYVDRLRAGAEAVGADFLDLNTTPLDGWCFVDRVHMNDRGNGLVAEAILELLS
jgi:hypothetical protein